MHASRQRPCRADDLVPNCSAHVVPFHAALKVHIKSKTKSKTKSETVTKFLSDSSSSSSSSSSDSSSDSESEGEGKDSKKEKKDKKKKDKKDKKKVMLCCTARALWGVDSPDRVLWFAACRRKPRCVPELYSRTCMVLAWRTWRCC